MEESSGYKPLRLITREQAKHIFDVLADEYALIPNPEGVFPSYDVVPLAPKVSELSVLPSAIFLDMDGTLTSTEELCLDALETLLKRFTWNGSSSEVVHIRPETDLAHIVGQSTTRNVEYLIKTYRRSFHARAVAEAFVEAVQWSWIKAQSPQRRREAEATLSALGLSDWIPPLNSAGRQAADTRMWQTTECSTRGDQQSNTQPSAAVLDATPGPLPSRQTWVEEFLQRVTLDDDALLRIGLEVYYQRQHTLLQAIDEAGDRREIAPVEKGFPEIRPLRGVTFFHVLVRGGLDTAEIQPEFLSLTTDECQIWGGTGEIRQRLFALAAALQHAGPRFVLVTSSGRFETRIILKEVFRRMREEVNAWPLQAAVRERIAARLDDPWSFYDAVLTADDAYELRLKPHRDLYTLALEALHLTPSQRESTLALEDTEAGILAARAAGIPMAIAVPFMSFGQDFSAASFVADAGLPEVLCRRHLGISRAGLESYLP